MSPGIFWVGINSLCPINRSVPKKTLFCSRSPPTNPCCCTNVKEAIAEPQPLFLNYLGSYVWYKIDFIFPCSSIRHQRSNTWGFFVVILMDGNAWYSIHFRAFKLAFWMWMWVLCVGFYTVCSWRIFFSHPHMPWARLRQESEVKSRLNSS